MSVSRERKDLILALANDEWERILSDEEYDNLEDEDFEKYYYDFFKNNPTPDELHLFADSWNWDGGVEQLYKIIEHPNCDLGTALLLYWRAQPDFYYKYKSELEIPESSLDGYKFIKPIEKRVQSGAYIQQNIIFNPQSDYGVSLIPKNKNAAARIPKEMYGPWYIPNK